MCPRCGTKLNRRTKMCGKCWHSFDRIFWEKINKIGPIVRPELGPCWIWTGCSDGKGYGVITINGKHHSTHKISYELHNGPIPNNLECCHECDNTICCNPAHLFIGTHLDNSIDMVKKKRHVHGIKQPTHKLTEEQVREIKYSTNTQVECAKRFSINQCEVSRIRNGKMWKHII